MDATSINVPTGFAPSISSAYALPPELLTDVFLHLYTDPSIPRAEHDLRNTHKLTFVMLVCKRWKDIVERAPILWTDIWLGQCPPYIANEDTRQWLDYIKTRFKRSGTLPLNLTIMAAYVDLGEVSQLLLQHISRCKALAFRALKDETDWTVRFRNTNYSTLHRILSSPLPAVQTIIIDHLPFGQAWPDPSCALMLDAPNLRDLTILSPDIIPFVESHHNSLKRLSISVDWEYILPHLPRDRLSLPNLKYLSVAHTDHLWDLLQVIDTPNLEHFVVNCDNANWSEEVDTVIPVMSNLQELEWHMDPDAVFEQGTLRHLLQHCPNITSLSYICNEALVESLRHYLNLGTLFDPMMSSSILLTRARGGTLKLCPNLRRVRIACASFEQIQKLVLRRPMLEHVSMQHRIPGEDVVASSSEDAWLAKVNMVRWIRSKIQFEFPTNVVPFGPDLRGEEGVFWDPNG